MIHTIKTLSDIYNLPVKDIPRAMREMSEIMVASRAIADKWTEAAKAGCNGNPALLQDLEEALKKEPFIRWPETSQWDDDESEIGLSSTLQVLVGDKVVEMEVHHTDPDAQIAQLRKRNDELSQELGNLCMRSMEISNSIRAEIVNKLKATILLCPKCGDKCTLEQASKEFGICPTPDCKTFVSEMDTERIHIIKRPSENEPIS